MIDAPEAQKKVVISWALFITVLIGSNSATHWGTLFWYKQVTLEERVEKKHNRQQDQIDKIVE